MITLTEMEARVKSLLDAVKNSADQHHILVGQSREAEAVLEYMKIKHAEAVADEAKKEETVEQAVEAVAEPAVDGAAGAIA